jgi:short-subunit dehydrogenase
VATCVILGAGKGIGQSVAKEFKSRGYHIALCARNKEKLTELAEQLGDQTSTWTVDVADAHNLKQTLAAIANSQGDIEVLIYNAYSAEPGKGSTLDVDKFNQSLLVNLSGALVAAQAVAPGMMAKEKGTIIFTGGGFALQPFHNQTSLSVGKAGLRALSQCLHQGAWTQGCPRCNSHRMWYRQGGHSICPRCHRQELHRPARPAQRSIRGRNHLHWKITLPLFCCSRPNVFSY